MVDPLLKALPKWTLVGYPRLVRLNPAVAWKTRGNGAVALTLSSDEHSADDGQAHVPSDQELADVLERASRVVAAGAALDDPSCGPGVVVSPRTLDMELYQEAVATIVPAERASRAIVQAQALSWSAGTRRGIIGAAAALAWPQQSVTFEILAYRHPSRIGTPRDVSDRCLERIEGAIPDSFHTRGRRGSALSVPSSPCPVLLGIRARSASHLPKVVDLLEGEAPASWRIFVTNHATDDHRLFAQVPSAPTGGATLQPFRPYDVIVEIGPPSRRRRGGHLLRGATLLQGRMRIAQITLAAFEPTKGLRNVLEALAPGDRCEVFGLCTRPDVLNLAKVRPLVVAPRPPPEPRPRCCDRSMRSCGRAGGLRCRTCGKRVEWQRPAAASSTASPVEVGRWYEVPAEARGHLHRPEAFDAQPP